jgi:hypothetical protein
MTDLAVKYIQALVTKEFPRNIVDRHVVAQ